MSRYKKIALPILIAVAVAVTLLSISTRDQNYWQLFDLITITAALLYFLPGAAVASLMGIIIGIIYFPGLINPINYVSLIILGGVAGWFSYRKKLTQDSLSRLSLVDRLTGLHNYSYFIDRLEEEHRRADRFGSSLSLIMVDIDFFKTLNDEYGHLVGNEFLKTLARVFLEGVRVIDIVCRYGGEEFAIILPNTSEEAAEVAERIREAVEKTDFQVAPGGKVERRTVSIGVANYPRDAEDEIQLIDRADEALYFAKQNGRNQVQVYGQERVGETPSGDSVND